MRTALLLALMLCPVATALSAEAGPVKVEATSEPAPACTLAVTSEVCIASWDDGEDSQDLGDDNVTVSRFANRVRASVEADELGPEREVTVNVSQFVIEHPAFHAANDSWILLNESLPGAARDYVTLESRPLNTGGENPPQGLLVVVHFPTPVPDPTRGGTMSWASFTILPMNSSFYFPTGYFRDTWSEDAIRPLPWGIWFDQTTDDEWDILVENFACEKLYVTSVPEFCLALNTTREEARSGGSAWKNATPDFGVGASVDRVEAEVTPSREHDQSASNGSIALLRSGRAVTTESPHRPRDVPVDLALPTGEIPEGPRNDFEGKVPRARGPQRPETIQSVAPPGRPPAWHVAAAVAAGGAILFGLAFALYHRISKREALDNENRLRVYNAVRENPGIRAGTLKAHLGLNYETVLWHLRVLEEHHLIEGSGEGQRRFFMNGGSFGPREKEEILAASSPTAKAVLEHLRRNGAVTLSALSEALGISASTASETVTRLQHARLLVKRRENGRLLVLPASALQGDPFSHAKNS